MNGQAGQRRFYKETGVTEIDDGWGVRLDRFALRTPARAVLAVPTEALARLIAEEWAAQGDVIVPVSMPVTRLANLAQDKGEASAAALVEEIVRYAASDLVCYRAEAPEGLVQRQLAAWDPMLDWFDRETGSRLLTTTGLTLLDQPQDALDAIRARAKALDHWRLTALAFVTGLTGSGVIGLMLDAGALTAPEALAAIRIEEDWHAGLWGRDPDEAAQAEARRADLVAAERYLQALSAGAKSGA